MQISYSVLHVFAEKFFAAGLLLLATLLTTVRLFSLHCGDAAKAEQHDDNSGDESHGDPPLDATQRSDGISEHYTIFFTRPSDLASSARLSNDPHPW
jgi:hypothetical protein